MRSKYHYINLPTCCNNSPGSWVKAALYYCNNFTEISTIIDMLHQDDDTECLQQAQQLIQNSSDLEMELNYIKQHFEILSQSIVKLQIRDLTLKESLATIDNIKNALENAKRLEFLEKFNKIITENLGLLELIEMDKKYDLIVDQKPPTIEENIEIYRYAPIVAADVAQLSYAKSLLENDKNFGANRVKKEKQEYNF